MTNKQGIALCATLLLLMILGFPWLMWGMMKYLRWIFGV